MSTNLKMAASAAVAAALTAAVFLTLINRPATRSSPPAGQTSEGPGRDPTAPLGAPSGDTKTGPGAGDLLRDLPTIEGDGVVRGRVATAGNDGLEGVVVVATPWTASSGPARLGEPPRLALDDEIRRAVEETYRRVTGTRRATTDEDGRYALSRLGDADYYLRAYAPGYDIRPAEGPAYPVRPGTTVDFVARAMVAVRVRIEGIDETVSGRVGVLCEHDEQDLKRAGVHGWSSDRQVLHLAPGTWWLQAVQGDDRERASQPRKITLEAGAPELTVVLHLLDRPGLRGTIVARDDLDVQSARVRALRFEGAEPPRVEDLARSRAGFQGRYDRRTSRYSFREIEPGRYVVWVTLGGDRAMGSSVVEIRDRVVEQDIEVDVADPGHFVVVRAIGPDGEPLDARDTVISTLYDGPRAVIGGGGETIHRTDGSWLVSHPPGTPSADAQTGGTYRIKVTHRSLGSQEIAYDPKTQHELEFRFGKTSSLVVTVSGLDRNGLTGIVSLYLRKSLDENGITLSGGDARSAGDAFVFDAVQPGEWLLVLVTQDADWIVIVDRLPIAVVEGENRIDWPLKQLYTVRLEPAKKAKSLRFCLKRLDSSGNWVHQYARSPEGGDVVFKFVPAGRYELAGYYEGENRRFNIDVPGQTHVRLE